MENLIIYSIIFFIILIGLILLYISLNPVEIKEKPLEVKKDEKFIGTTTEESRTFDITVLQGTAGTHYTITTIGDEKCIVFKQNNQISFEKDIPNCKILVVGGGGAGGNSMGGGGGAGGVVYTVNQTLNAGTYSIIIGSGGVGMSHPGGSGQGNRAASTNGSESAIKNSDGSRYISMIMGGISQELRGYGGGGGGVYYNRSFLDGLPGGSGGGASEDNNEGIANGGAGTQPLTYWNGSSYESGGSAGNNTQVDRNFYTYLAGGGGGAGKSNYGNNYINGKNGVFIDITGTQTVYAAGGGGAQYTGTPANVSINVGYGGNYTGGQGEIWNGSSYTRRASSGVANTGSGGGGIAYFQAPVGTAGNGGSGVVIIRYRPVVEQPEPSQGRVASTLDMNTINDSDAKLLKSSNSKLIIEGATEPLSEGIAHGLGGRYHNARTRASNPLFTSQSYFCYFSSFDSTTGLNPIPYPTYLFSPPAVVEVSNQNSYFLPRRYNPATGDFIFDPTNQSDTSAVNINILRPDGSRYNNRTLAFTPTATITSLPSTVKKIRGEYVGIRCEPVSKLIGYSFTANLAFENQAPGAWVVLGRKNSTSDNDITTAYEIISESPKDSNNEYIRQQWDIYYNSDQKKVVYLSNNDKEFNEYLFIFPKLAQTDLRANINYGHQLIFKKIELHKFIPRTSEILI